MTDILSVWMVIDTNHHDRVDSIWLSRVEAKARCWNIVDLCEDGAVFHPYIVHFPLSSSTGYAAVDEKGSCGVGIIVEGDSDRKQVVLHASSAKVPTHEKT